MFKNDIAESVLQFCFNTGMNVNDIVIGYGAAAVMHGIRNQTNDIDIDTSEAIFEWVWCMEGAVSGKGLTGQFVSIGNQLDFHIGDHEDKEFIDGIWVVSKAELLRQYEWLHSHPERIVTKRATDYEVIQALKAQL